MIMTDSTSRQRSASSGMTPMSSDLIGLLCLTGLCLSFSCVPSPTVRDSNSRENPSALDTSTATASDAGSSSPFEGPRQKRLVEFTVHRISGPKGAFGNEAQLWKIAGTPIRDAPTSLRLRANGFRAAVGRESDRPALLAFLEKLPDRKTVMDRVIPDARRWLDIEIGRIGRRQSVFVYDTNGDLSGLDLVDAEARFKLAFEIRSLKAKAITVRVVPELEESRGRMKWEKQADGRLLEVPDTRRRIFESLSFSADISEGGFLVLAATPSVFERPLLGRAFFVEGAVEAGADCGNCRENLYIIGPAVRSNNEEAAQ